MRRWTGTLACLALLATASCTRTEPATAPVPAQAPQIAPVAAPATPAATAQRWPADAPLSAGMARIRIATDALAHAEHGHLNAGQVVALADELDSAVNAMFAECKLEPAADAALHPLLARVLQSSQALRKSPSDPAPVGELREVLRRYPQLFEDPDWPAVRSGG